MKLGLVFLLLISISGVAHGQAVLQSGSAVGGRAMMYVPSGSSVSGAPGYAMDSGPAGNWTLGQGLNELLQVNRFPGNGPGGAHSCSYDSASPTQAQHYLCFDSNLQGGGLIEYGAINGGTPLPLNCNINGITSACVGATVIGATVVPTTAALKLVSSPSAGQSVLRLGYYAQGDSPETAYFFSSTACSLNAGAGDGGSQIQPTSGGGCWNAVAPPTDDRVFGVVHDNATDNSTAFQNALTWAATNKAVLKLAPGTIFYVTPATISLAAGGALTVQGSGADLTVIRPAGNGLTITQASGDLGRNVHLRDFSCVASTSNVNTCLTMTAVGNIASPGFAAASDVTGVVFRGNQYSTGATACWQNGISTNYWSNITFTNDVFVGCGGGSAGANLGTGVALSGGTSVNTTGVVFNFQSSNFINLNTGISFGTFIQGVAVTGNSNFTYDAIGISVPAGGVSQSQLSVIGDQFGYNNLAISDASGVVGTIIQGNNIFIATALQNGVQIVTNGCSVIGNTIYGVGNASTIGVNVTGSVAGNLGCTIIGNDIDTLTYGVNINPSVSGLVEASNHYANNVNNVANANTSAGANMIKCCAPQTVNVSGAVGVNGNTNTQLTVSSTNVFNTGNVVLVQGIVGSSGNGAWAAQVVDSTHLLLVGAGFSGSYTSGGIVSILP